MDGTIRVGTKIDFSGVKNDIKALEKELAAAQKEIEKLNQEEVKVRKDYDEKREFDSQFPEEMSHRESIDKEAAEKLFPVTVSAIDSAVTKGVIHKNNANNRKAKLAKKLAAMA